MKRKEKRKFPLVPVGKVAPRSSTGWLSGTKGG